MNCYHYFEMDSIPGILESTILILGQWVRFTSVLLCVAILQFQWLTADMWANTRSPPVGELHLLGCKSFLKGDDLCWSAWASVFHLTVALFGSARTSGNYAAALTSHQAYRAVVEQKSRTLTTYGTKSQRKTDHRRITDPDFQVVQSLQHFPCFTLKSDMTKITCGQTYQVQSPLQF